MNTEDWRVIVYRKVWSFGGLRKSGIQIEDREEWESDDWLDALAYYEEQKMRYRGNIALLQLGLTDGEETIVLSEVFS